MIQNRSTTLVSFIFLLINIYRNRSYLLSFDPAQSLSVQLTFFIGLTMCYHIGIYSIFQILTRYALPIAPLHLTAAALFLDRITNPNMFLPLK